MTPQIVGGRLGVVLADALIRREAVTLALSGRDFATIDQPIFERLGILIPTHRRPPLCRPCLDWTERRFHLAGRLGAVGVRGLREAFGVEWAA